MAHSRAENCTSPPAYAFMPDIDAPTLLAQQLESERAMTAFLAEMDELDRLDMKQPITDFSAPPFPSTAFVSLQPNCSVNVGISQDISASTLDYVDGEAEMATANAGKGICKKNNPKMRKQKSKQKPKSSWLRKKEEMAALREESAQLQAQLESLQAYGVPSTALVGRLESSEAHKERPAKNEKRDSHAMEQENQQLRAMVRVHLQMANSIRQLLTKRGHVSLPEPLPSCKRVCVSNFSDMNVFDLLESNINARYSQLDQVWESAKARSPTTERHEARINVDDADRAVVDLNDTRILPFDLPAVSNASWKCVTMVVEDDVCTGTIIQKSDDTIAMDVTWTLPKKNSDEQVHIFVKAMAKRFVSKDRIIVLFEGTTSWPSDTGMWCSSTRETGWGVIQPHPVDGPSSPICVIQASVRVTPDVSSAPPPSSSSSSPESEHHQQILGDVVIPSYQYIIQTRHQLVENMLLDEMRNMSI